MSMLVIVIYSSALVYISTSTVFLLGPGVANHHLCLAMSWVCNLMYGVVKLGLIVSLLERTHIVRAPFTRRRDDRIYITCLTTIFISFTSLAVTSYINAYSLVESDGRCYLGVRGNVAMYALAINTLVDLALESVFFCLLRLSSNVHAIPTVTKALNNFRRGNNPPVEDERKKTPV
jgi:hypothetical protein